jgi:tetratricopeptide (TPR) repeat protein
MYSRHHSTHTQARVTLLLGLMLAAPASPAAARAQEAAHVHATPAARATPATPATHGERATPLLDGLGDLHHPISTTDTLAQRYFDQGLRLAYAFNHGEAIRSFEEAARLDPSCAMCYWGKALALGPNINAPMDTAAAREAYAALRQARSLAARATDRERAYVDALAARYAAEPSADRAELDAAYAAAMREVARRAPDDPDAATLFAEALMDTSPWDYWKADGSPKPATREILSALERALARNPNHPGACHYYIHAVEAVYPERAVACAERLAALMPAAGHIVHMPGHIYIRVGRYNDAIQANVHAVHADEAYIAERRPEGVYPAGYYPHNFHFLAFAATLAGRSADAVEAARATARHTPIEAARQSPESQLQLAYPHLTLAKFGRWDDVLGEALPPADLRVASGIAHYARGLAFAAEGQWTEAQAALDSVTRAAADVAQGPSDAVLDIATHALRGEIAARCGQLDAAVGHYGTAMRLEDGLGYMEPPYWHTPIRHQLGALLLQAGRAREAEALYREDLRRFPENGWSLAGLRQSLAAQRKSVEAESVGRRFATAWRQADVPLTTSRR